MKNPTPEQRDALLRIATSCYTEKDLEVVQELRHLINVRADGWNLTAKGIAYTDCLIGQDAARRTSAMAEGARRMKFKDIEIDECFRWNGSVYHKTDDTRALRVDGEIGQCWLIPGEADVEPLCDVPWCQNYNPRVTEQAPPTPNDKPAIWDLVMADFKARDAEGRRKYGTPLQAGNGRDALVDAYQEALDQVVYLRQEIEERQEEREKIADFINRCASLEGPTDSPYKLLMKYAKKIRNGEYEK